MQQWHQSLSRFPESKQLDLQFGEGFWVSLTRSHQNLLLECIADGDLNQRVRATRNGRIEQGFTTQV